MKTFLQILISDKHARLRKSSKALKDGELEEEKIILRKMGEKIFLV